MTLKQTLWMALLLGLALVSTALAFNIPGLSGPEKVKGVNGAVTFPIAKVADGKAHFYRYVDGGKEIGFFLVKGSDGQIHSAFNACDACYREKKGYQQDGDSMLCKNCNKKFLVNRIGPHSVGGCNPAYLPATSNNGSVIIRTADLQKGAGYF